MRKFNSKLTGTLRIVSVEDADICTCCGTHPPFTGMLGSVKVIRHEKHKGGCRVEFVCGRRALLDADAKNSTLLSVAASLSVKPEQVPAAVNKQKNDLLAQLDIAKSKLLKIEEEKLQETYAAAPVNADGVKVLALPMEGHDAKDIKAFLPKVTALENTLSLLVAVQPERISYAVALGLILQAIAVVLLSCLTKPLAAVAAARATARRAVRIIAPTGRKSCRAL